MLPAIIASTTIDAAVDHRQACAGAGCPSLPAPMVAVLDVSQSPADADAWALHPEPGPVTGVTGFRGHVNTPVVPDENDTTPGEETMPGVDQAPAGTE